MGKRPCLESSNIYELFLRSYDRTLKSPRSRRGLGGRPTRMRGHRWLSTSNFGFDNCVLPCRSRFACAVEIARLVAVFPATVRCITNTRAVLGYGQGLHSIFTSLQHVSSSIWWRSARPQERERVLDASAGSRPFGAPPQMGVPTKRSFSVPSRRARTQGEWCLT